MKFGENLSQRSVPQWAPYNVDYDEIKRLIKARTSVVPANPISIPGQALPNHTWKSVEAELFPILKAQHDHVSLFTKSKFGEISRRLDFLEKQVSHLALGKASSRRPLNQTRKFSNLVEESRTIGDDVQSLSRYVSAQRLAFRKILKKYRKWTGSSSLDLKWNNEVLRKQEVSLHPDLPALLAQLSNIISTLNELSTATAFTDKHVEGGGQQSSHMPSTGAVRIFNSSQQSKCPLLMDAAFVATPLGESAGRASYWIHPENLEEAKVLLLRQMKNSPSPPSSGATTPVSTDLLDGPQLPRKPLYTPKDRLHITLYDNPQKFVEQQSIDADDQSQGSIGTKVALATYWTETELEATFTVSDLTPSRSLSMSVHIGRIKRKWLCKALAGKSESSTLKSQGSSVVETQLLQEFFAQHRDVKPIAEIHTSRSRFSGIKNSTDVGTWALLDSDITVSHADLMPSKTGDRPPCALHSKSSGTEAIQTFPYAVLQIRWEFSPVPEIVRAFDSTDLAERIPKFSIETEAIHRVYKPELAALSWQPLLQKDIRKIPLLNTKLPSQKENGGNRSSETTIVSSSGPSSANAPSDSIFSTTKGHSSSTSIQDLKLSRSVMSSQDESGASNKARPPRAKKRHPRPPSDTGNGAAQRTEARYWNEFDDGEEFLEERGYTIYVNPDEPTSLLGAQAVSKALSSMYQSLSKGKGRVLSWLPLRSHNVVDPERRALLVPQNDVEDLSDSDSSAETPRPATLASSKKGRKLQSNVTTQAYRLRDKLRDSREKSIFRTYFAAFLISFGLLVLSALLHHTGRHKSAIEVNTGVIIGTVASVCCGIGGVTLMLSRKEHLSWLHRGLVYCAFFVVCAGGGWLLALVGRKRR